MIASLTRAMIVAHLLTLAAVALLLVKFAGLGWAAALAASAALVTLARFGVIINNYFLTDALRQPMADGSPVSRRRLASRVVQEFWCSSLCWFRLFPFGRPFEVRIDGDAGLPVLMLHGYGSNSGFWLPFSRRLRAAGISHAAIDLEPILADIDDYAPRIERAVQALCEATGAPQVILLCHSMGGLAARAWLRAFGSARAARVITLGTPHFGSTLAGFAVGANARQMLTPAGDPDSWIARLDASENAALRGLFVSVYTRHDNIVSPQSSAILPGASHVALDLVGHVALGFDHSVGERVNAEIRSARQSRSTAGSQ